MTPLILLAALTTALVVAVRTVLRWYGKAFLGDGWVEL